jgi:hypothetical protein
MANRADSRLAGRSEPAQVVPKVFDSIRFTGLNSDQRWRKGALILGHYPMRRRTMAIQPTTIPSSSDVLHAEHHTQLSAEEVAKAVARHQREHPAHGGTSTAPKPQKTTPHR